MSHYENSHYEPSRYEPAPQNGNGQHVNSKPQTGVINFDKYDSIPVKVTGRDCPPPINSWRECDLGEVLHENIEAAGYTRPTPVQKYALPTVLNDRDLMGCAQTGSGKTAAFLLPIIAQMLRNKQYNIRDPERRTVNPSALILAPTRELACQILDEAKKFCAGSSIRTAILYGGVPMGEQLRDLFRGADVLVATPGRLTDVMARQKVSLRYIRYLVLDEADRMLDMGFEPQIRKIVEEFDMPKTEERQTLMFSATFPKEIRALAASFLRDYVFLTIGKVGSTTDLVEQRFILVSNDQDREFQLMDLLRKSPDALTLIFVETKKKANYLDHFLRRQGFSATSIHGDRNQMERTSALRAFSSGMTPVLIATNVAARGLDITGITHVINYEMAANIDDYVHRIGRTGRAGKAGVATTFISEENSNIVGDLIKLLTDENKEVPTWLRGLDRSGRGRPSYGRGFPQSRTGYGGSRTTYYPPSSSYNTNSSYPPQPSTASSYGQPPYQYVPPATYPAPPPTSNYPPPSGSSYPYPNPPTSAPAPPPPSYHAPASSTSTTSTSSHSYSNGYGDRDRERDVRSPSSYDRKRRPEDDYDHSRDRERDNRDKYQKTDSHRVSSDRGHYHSSHSSSSRSYSRDDRDGRDRDYYHRDSRSDRQDRDRDHRY